MPRCREKVRVIDDNISTMEKDSDEDVEKLEERRTALINIINEIIDEKKRKREKRGDQKWRNKGVNY